MLARPKIVALVIGAVICGLLVVVGWKLQASHESAEPAAVCDDRDILVERGDDGNFHTMKLLSDSNESHPVTVHVLVGMGQSNMSGRGTPVNEILDPPDPRIYQFGSGATDLTQATVPLAMVDEASGLSPLTVIARDYLARIPAEDIIVLVPAANGGSPLGASGDENKNGVWNLDYKGRSPDLYRMAVNQIDGALSAIEARWTDADIHLVGMFWHQGEANARDGTTEAVYAQRFDELVNALRTHFQACVPVTVGGMVPKGIAAAPGGPAIRAAHVDTPRRLLLTGYADGVVDGGGTLHYDREGVIELGHRMLDAYDRSRSNVDTSTPAAPEEVSADVIGGQLTVTWSQPPCRYTGFKVEYRLVDGPWIEVPDTNVDTIATASGVVAPVLVRVATINENGVSAPTDPVYATATH